MKRVSVFSMSLLAGCWGLSSCLVWRDAFWGGYLLGSVLVQACGDCFTTRGLCWVFSLL